MKQRCSLLSLYFNWLAYLTGAIVLAAAGKYWLLALWMVLTPVFQVAYIRVFPRLSKALGYGSVEDTSAVETTPTPVTVMLYTAAGCPFCPILEQRLEALRPAMGFHLAKVDVTVRPDIVSRQKIRAVPVVTVGGRTRTGNLTSRELVDLITAGQTGSMGV